MTCYFTAWKLLQAKQFQFHGENYGKFCDWKILIFLKYVFRFYGENSWLVNSVNIFLKFVNFYIPVEKIKSIRKNCKHLPILLNEIVSVLSHFPSIPITLWRFTLWHWVNFNKILAILLRIVLWETIGVFIPVVIITWLIILIMLLLELPVIAFATCQNQKSKLHNFKKYYKLMAFKYFF